MVPSAHTATLPESDIIRHDDYAITHSQFPSPTRYVDHHPREGLYRQYTSQLHGKCDPQEGFSFVYPSPHHTESQFGSPADHKALNHTPNSYLSPSFDSAYISCESPHSHPTPIQEPRFCNAENLSAYPTFRVSHATFNENQSTRPDLNSHALPPPPSSHTLPLLVHPSDSYVAYTTEPQTSDYYHSIQGVSYPFYATCGRAFNMSELNPAVIAGEMNHYPPPTQSQTSDRPFKCSTCPAGFNRNHDLKRHTRIHLAVKPFPCGWCSKTFSRKDALKRHLLVKGCAGTDKVTVDESIRRAEENRLSQNFNIEPPSFPIPFSTQSQPPAHATQAAEDIGHSPSDDSNFLSGSSGSEEGQSTVSNVEPSVPRYGRSDRVLKHSRASLDGGSASERFLPYARPTPYHHRSQPNILEYGRESWPSSDLKATGYPSSEATAVLPPPKPSEFSSTSSISSLLDGPDYGAEFRATYDHHNRSAIAPMYSHPSTPATYTQPTPFPSEEYSRPMYHSTPRSSTSDSICSASTMTTSNSTVKSESPVANPQQNLTLSPPLTPSGTASINDRNLVSSADVPFNATTSPTEYAAEIKRERTSRSPTPQEVPCISSIRCRAN
ncbi:hypothetical protein CROQUDRAFT_46512 [Cronartium quercuum f. sp. fusiforme G11]|uniref:C2H2-type domain-containing protein n=1 Tax=Cronartium quercuum f. sp. fusiforme G11 TaxID=708437 RepID=A0A9P6TBU7_9BASI|nr:hypothetical protein CROQUDRAFT_46512 [Cronartium quercuum f. sp. fusiforme G11]